MAQPTDKNPEIENLLSALTGDNRREAIAGNRCIKPPIGCGKPALQFKDELSRKEFTISGLCQECQDKIFEDDC